MTQLDQVLYTAKAHTTGGRDAASWSDDGRPDVTKLVLPLGRMIMPAYAVAVHQGVIGNEPD